jgi:hypothetical protein
MGEIATAPARPTMPPPGKARAILGLLGAGLAQRSSTSISAGAA